MNNPPRLGRPAYEVSIRFMPTSQRDHCLADIAGRLILILVMMLIGGTTCPAQEAPTTGTSVCLYAGLYNYNVAAAFGNVKIHWGEAWSKGDFNMPAKSWKRHDEKGPFGNVKRDPLKS